MRLRFMNKLFKFVFQRISKKTIFPILVLFFLPFIQNESKGQETIDQKIFVQEIVPHSVASIQSLVPI